MKRNLIIPTAVAVLLTAARAGSVFAAPVVTIPNGLPSAGAGSLDVTATDIGTDQVGSYQISVLAVPSANATGGLTLIAAQAPNPLFPSQQPLGGLTKDSTTKQNYFITSDDLISGGTVTLGPLPKDLFLLNYTPLPGTFGTFNITIFTSSTDPLGSYLGGAIDGGGVRPPIANTVFINGSVTITPEPGSFALACIFGAGLLLRRHAFYSPQK